MIHLALTIWAYMFVFGIVIAVLVGVFIHWRESLAVLGVLLVLGYAMFRASDHGSSATSSVPLYTQVPRVPLSERLHYNPPLIVPVPDGEAWFIAAYPSSMHRVRLIVRFTDRRPGLNMLSGDARNALVALKGSLCGERGLLADYALHAPDLVIVAYDRDTRVGEVDLPENYCALNAKWHDAQAQIRAVR